MHNNGRILNMRGEMITPFSACNQAKSCSRQIAAKILKA